VTRQYNQICPIARTLDLVGDRWTLLILRDMAFGKSKFREFLDNPGLPPKVLSERLKKLTGEGLVERVVYSQHPLRAEYRLTEKGRSLGPVLEAVAAWGMEHCLSEGERAAVRSQLDQAEARAGFRPNI
jgi:DNA-binding HxlR family transcriptional regulator